MNNEKDTNELPEGVTQEMIEAWKTKYGAGEIKLLPLPMDDNNSRFYNVIARVPDRPTLSEFEKWMDKNPDKAKDIMVTNCLLTGIEQVKADKYLFLSAAGAIAELIPIRKVRIKNL